MLGACVAESLHLSSLRVPSCSTRCQLLARNGEVAGHDMSIEYFFEHLSHNTTLTFLDVSLNRIDYRGSLVLEDALEQHKTLWNLRISDNRLDVK